MASSGASDYHNYNMPEHETLVQCPYNKAHQILKHRLQTHLVKCRRTYPRDKKFVQCKYNTTHVFPEPEIKMHETNCESKIEVLRTLYKEEEKNETIRAPRIQHNNIVDPRHNNPFFEETWDEEHVISYDPNAYCATANIIRNVQHMTPSERKAFREAERRRLNEIANKGVN